MMSISARSAMTRRENHSHGSPTRRNKARYLAMAGLFQRTSRKCEEGRGAGFGRAIRSEEHTSELQSLMRISYAVFCLNKIKKTKNDIKYKKAAVILRET